MANPRICKIEGCDKGGKIRRGWCSMHYLRWRRHGDPLAGRTPNGEIERYYREVVLTYDGDDCLTWPYSRSGGGYGMMWLDGRMCCVPRVACEEANGHPPSPKHEAAHSCGNGHEGCVTKRHLSWKTPKANCADKLSHGTLRRGERCAATKLTESAVLEIRAMRGAAPQGVIAARFGISRENVSAIHRRKSWAWLSE